MKLDPLLEASNNALDEIENLISKNGSNDALNSIKDQIEFIKKHAENGINPKSQLGDNKFTYPIISSREFANPDEMILQNKLDKVTVILRDIPRNFPGVV